MKNRLRRGASEEVRPGLNREGENFDQTEKKQETTKGGSVTEPAKKKSQGRDLAKKKKKTELPCHGSLEDRRGTGKKRGG